MVETSWSPLSGSDRERLVTVIYHSPEVEDVLACSYEMVVERVTPPRDSGCVRP